MNNDETDQKKPAENQDNAKPVNDATAAPEQPPAVESVAASAPAIEPAAQAVPEPEPQPEPQPTPEPVPEPPPAPKPEPLPDPSPEPTPEPGPVPMPEPDPMPEPEPVPMPEPDPMPEPEPVPMPEPEPAPEPIRTPNHEPDPQPEPGAEPGPEKAVNSDEEPEAGPTPEPEPKPLRVYEYRYVRARQNAWDQVEQAILRQGAEAVTKAGGQLYGVWAGQIGLSANQGVVVTVWSDLETAKREGGSAIAKIDGISASETLYMEPTARPLDPAAPEGPGMFAHRIFEVRRDDADRFVALSDEAWPQQVFGARVFALWREVGHDRAMDRLILLTRYPDYTAWENSRFWRPDPNPNASDALQRFRERRQITVDTGVYTTRLATAAAG